MLPSLQIGPLVIYTFGLAVGLAICVGWLTFERYFRLHGMLGPIDMPVLGCILIVCGYAGSKLDTAIAALLSSAHLNRSFTQVLTNPAIGYTYLGCLLFGWLGGAVYARLRGVPALRAYDSMFCIAPAYAVGRIGCFLSGDGDYGVPTTLPWGVSFPHGIVPTTARVHPTMLYLSMWEAAVFLILWRISAPTRKPPLRAGTLLAVYLLATSAGRFAVESLSLNPRLAWGLTEAQLVSALLGTAGLLLLLAFRFSPSGQSFSMRNAPHWAGHASAAQNTPLGE
jgi:phosphatidylglycerol:prolipoprotein diacylglycerol transferase